MKTKKFLSQFVSVSVLHALIGLQPCALAAENEPPSYTGELAVGLRSESGKPESIKFRYAFGEYDGAQSLEGETETLRSLVESLPETPSEVPHIIDVFAKDTPKDLVKAERMVARLRGITRKLETELGEKARRIEIQVVPVPKEVVSPAEAPELRALIKGAISKPTSYDVRTGTIIGTYGGAISFSTWFSTPGIDPLVATGLATYQTALSSFHATFSKSVSNVFAINMKKPGMPIRKSTMYARRIGYGILLTELTRYFAGTSPGGAPQFTLAGQSQIVAVTMGYSVLNTLIINARDKAFMDQPARFAYSYLASYFLLSPWTMADFAGTFPVLLDLTVYQVRASTFGILGTYIAIHQAFTHAPNKVGTVLDKVVAPLDRLVARSQRTIGKRCSSLFDQAADFGDSFRDFVR